MKKRFSTLCLFLGTLAAASAGCDIDIDPPDDGGGSGYDTDGEDENSGGGKSVLSAGGSDGSGGASDDSGDPGDSAGSGGSGLTTAGPDDDGGSSGYDPEWPGNDNTGTGGYEPSDACGSYCEAELSCDDFYASAQECMTECNGMRAEAASCAPALDQLNACLGYLTCHEFSQYWAALDAISNEQDPGDFPCLPELAGFANCLDGGTPPGSP